MGVNVTDPRGYGTGGRSWRRSAASVTVVTDGGVVALAVVVVAAVRTGSPAVAILFGLIVGATLAVVASSPPIALVVVVLAVGGAVRSQHEWAGLAPDVLGPFEGWVRLVDDPQPYPSSTRVIVEVEGRAVRAVVARSCAAAAGACMARRRMGDGQWRTSPARRERARRVAWQHVVGEFDLAWASDVDVGGPVARASNRVRATIERAAESLPEPDGSLYRGLVIGDDRDQPRDMIDRFRASGLSHLTAVSGQNVAFVLAACGPLLVRLRPLPRWVLTVGVIAWFVALTRFEPSILRAGVMAGLSATAYATGRERSPLRILALAVIGWCWSIRCSCGRSGSGCRSARPGGLHGGAVAGRQVWRCWARSPSRSGSRWVRSSGWCCPSVLVFGRLPLVSVVANLLAVPVAGFVMLYGLPAGLVAGSIPPVAPVVMFPAHVGTRWVDTVAQLGGATRARPPWTWIGWGMVAAVVCWLVCRRGQRDAIRIEVDMATHLLSGNDESVLRSAVHELVDELVGDGDRAMMVDEFDGDDYELRRWSTPRRRRRSSPTSVWWWPAASNGSPPTSSPRCWRTSPTRSTPRISCWWSAAAAFRRSSATPSRRWVWSPTPRRRRGPRIARLDRRPHRRRRLRIKPDAAAQLGGMAR
jgi:competence protein ComEC